jgi:hypothetical protein
MTTKIIMTAFILTIFTGCSRENSQPTTPAQPPTVQEGMQSTTTTTTVKEVN